MYLNRSSPIKNFIAVVTSMNEYGTIYDRFGLFDRTRSCVVRKRAASSPAELSSDGVEHRTLGSTCHDMRSEKGS